MKDPPGGPLKGEKLSPSGMACQADSRLRDASRSLFVYHGQDMDVSPSAAPDARRFRDVMGAFPTGVAVVTARLPGGEPVGLTVSSLTSVSLEPLLVLVCIDHRSASHDAVVESGAFAVNLLPADAASISDVFASPDRGDRFRDLGWRAEATGSPVLDRALGWLDCKVHQTHVAGDHTIVVGRVLALDAGDPPPLVYHRGSYRRLAEP